MLAQTSVSFLVAIAAWLSFVSRVCVFLLCGWALTKPKFQVNIKQDLGKLGCLEILAAVGVWGVCEVSSGSFEESQAEPLLALTAPMSRPLPSKHVD